MPRITLLMALACLALAPLGCGSASRTCPKKAVEFAPHTHCGGGCDTCKHGKAGEEVWCDSCSKGFVDGEKVSCKTCFEGRTGETVWCEHCDKGYVDKRELTCRACFDTMSSGGGLCHECAATAGEAAPGEAPAE
jgi:hypothetical protein